MCAGSLRLLQTLRRKQVMSISMWSKSGRCCIGTPAEIAARAGASGPLLLFKWIRRTLPVAVLGQGATSAAHKVAKVVHALALETGDELMDHRLENITGFLADQGAEIKIGDAPKICENIADIIKTIETDEVSWLETSAFKAYLLPKALTFPDNLHAVFNALEEGMKSSSCWTPFEPLFRQACLFSATRNPRQVHRDLHGWSKSPGTTSLSCIQRACFRVAMLGSPRRNVDTDCGAMGFLYHILGQGCDVHGVVI